ncbi:chlamydia polymorphic membrane middle domain protein, partial [Chlamydia psittaci 01DC11]
CQSSRCRR